MNETTDDASAAWGDIEAPIVKQRAREIAAQLIGDVADARDPRDWMAREDLQDAARALLDPEVSPAPAAEPTLTPASDVELAFLQVQMLMRVGPEQQDDADELRAGIHVERNGSSGVHLPALYAGDEDRLILDRRIREQTIRSLRNVADALEAHLAESA